MVECLLWLTRTIKNGNSEGHLSCVDSIIGNLFALLLNTYPFKLFYYIAGMRTPGKTYPSMWKKFKRGNWIVRNGKTFHSGYGWNT